MTPAIVAVALAILSGLGFLATKHFKVYDRIWMAIAGVAVVISFIVGAYYVGKGHGFDLGHRVTRALKERDIPHMGMHYFSSSMLSLSAAFGFFLILILLWRIGGMIEEHKQKPKDEE